MKAPPSGQFVHESQPRELLEHLVKVQHPDLVGDALGYTVERYAIGDIGETIFSQSSLEQHLAELVGHKHG